VVWGREVVFILERKKKCSLTWRSLTKGPGLRGAHRAQPAVGTGWTGASVSWWEAGQTKESLSGDTKGIGITGSRGEPNGGKRVKISRDLSACEKERGDRAAGGPGNRWIATGYGCGRFAGRSPGGISRGEFEGRLKYCLAHTKWVRGLLGREN